MALVHHLNCVKIVSPISDHVTGHCLLLEDDSGNLALIDTGMGVMDTRHPAERIGTDLINMVGFRFEESITAIRQIEKLGFNALNLSDCILSHLDPDHAGGLADFPWATVHVSSEEWEHFNSGHPRYLPHQLAHRPLIARYGPSGAKWFGFEARRVQSYLQWEILLVPLFGHTKGHCGVAIKKDQQWIFYVGDAYYLQEELQEGVLHPVSELATASADDNELRLRSLEQIRQLKKEHPEITIFCYHDGSELDQMMRHRQVALK